MGPARARAFSRIGVADVRDLLLLVPRRISTAGPRVSPGEARRLLGSSVVVSGRISKVSLQRFGRRSTLRVTLGDGADSIPALFFNQPWLRKRFEVGATVEISGKVGDSRGPALVSPRIGSNGRPLAATGTFEPIYPLADGLGQDLVRRLCAEAARRSADLVSERLALEDLERLELPPLPRAVAEVHAPSSEASFRAARRRIALEPLLRIQSQVAARRRARSSARARVAVVEQGLHARILGGLPFRMTAGQSRIALELRRDLARSTPMRRLLQGDVGSGKTALGVYACAVVASAGGQSAFLAPTELLAEQHFDGQRAWLASLGLHAVLLTGSLPAAERRAVLAQIESGMADVAIGTHALLSADVRYRRLALAVIDEQQRFGVAQRARLLEKGDGVHALLMTATPIPRTLAMTLYGDLDVSLLREAPPGRGVLRTRWVRAADRRRVRPFLVERLEAGEQVYFVSPRVGEAGEGLEDAIEHDAGSAEAAMVRLSRTPLARFGIELVHGRVAPAERARRLERFRRSEAKVLVATTVIEVGVDVPAATVMIVENAERLGLAQLHQLRGRVGRGPKESWCLLFGKDSARERLELLERTRDGFEIAEADLRARGMGDLAGRRQAGESLEGLEDPEGDLDLLFAARDLVAARPDLARHYGDPAREAATP